LVVSGSMLVFAIYQSNELMSAQPPNEKS
jgi:hypothetical protein